MPGRVGLAHQRQSELIHALLRHRQADQPAGMARHEVDRVGRRELGGNHQVALVLAVLVVDQHEHTPGARLFDQVGRAAEIVGKECLLHETSDARAT